MRILLDENMDRRLKRSFKAEHTVLTVPECGWAGKKNGALLSLAEKEFDVFVTMDQGIEYQQNLLQFDLGIVFLKAFSNRRVDVEPLMPQVNQQIESIRPGSIIHIP